MVSRFKSELPGRFQKRKALDVADCPAYFNYQYLGACYTAQGKVNEAMGAYERMCELNPDESLKAWVSQWKVQMGVAA